MVTLRKYQQEAVDAVIQKWDDGQLRQLLVLPTGTGKTICFAEIAKREVMAGRRVLILAHRGELLDQARDKIKKSTGLECSVEKAEESCLSLPYRITVGSVQTLYREDRLVQFRHDHFDTIIVDEAHHVLADTYMTILSYFFDARVLGVTATPDRGDLKDLGNFFDGIAYQYSLPRAIKDGYLSRIRAMTIPLKLDITGVKVQSGDYSAGQLGSALDPYLEQIAEEMKQYCTNRKTVVFLPLIATAQKMCGLLNNKGFRAGEVHGTSQDRAEILSDFDNGKYDVLCNSMLLTEGWDCPSVDCIVMLRPTKIRSLYCQCIGRGTRLHDRKDNLLVLDFLWLTERHDLVRPAALICSSQEVADQMEKRLDETAGTDTDILDAVEDAEADAIADREAKLAKQLEKMKHRKRKLVDPLQYAMSIMDNDLQEYQPIFESETKAPLAAQLKELETRGIFPDEISSFGMADKLLQRLRQRTEEGLATPKQIRYLEGRGFHHVGQWKFRDATAMMARISSNGWHIPIGINPATYEP